MHFLLIPNYIILEFKHKYIFLIFPILSLLIHFSLLNYNNNNTKIENLRKLKKKKIYSKIKYKFVIG